MIKLPQTNPNQAIVDDRAAAHGAKPIGTIRMAAVASVASAALVASASLAMARETPESFADLAEEVAPAVVNISVVQDASAQPQFPFPNGPRDFFGQPNPLDPNAPGADPRFNGPQGQAPAVPAPRSVQGVGSGFVIDPDGYIVTNHHVVDGAREISVTFTDGETLDAELIGSDQRTDLALLKVETDEELPFVSFGSSDEMRPGDWVVAVGNPFGLGGTVTVGILSARGRDLAGGSLVDYLQIDAPINRGNSGGPAFNDAGDVIGINSAIFSPNGGSVGIGFAIPSETAQEVVADLRENGRVERGWLGVRIQPVTEDMAEGFGLTEAEGALVAMVEPNSPAEAAGLKAGDVILAWDGEAVINVKDLTQLVAATDADEKVEVKLWRKQGEHSLDVVTGVLEPEKVAAAVQPLQPDVPSFEPTMLPGTGVGLVDLDEPLRVRFGIDDGVSGVLVAQVEDGSSAAQIGLRPGDVIQSLSLEPVDNVDQAVETFEKNRADGREVLPVLIVRDGGESFVSLRVKEA
ncbi:MAG: Do family serine endopeptidase [Pseudomonadota bacterium]